MLNIERNKERESLATSKYRSSFKYMAVQTSKDSEIVEETPSVQNDGFQNLNDIKYNSGAVEKPSPINI